MARKSSGKSSSAENPSKVTSIQTRWFNYRLTETDIPAVISDCDEPKELAVRLGGLFARDVDFSLRYDSKRKNWSAFAIYPQFEGGDFRTGISAFGGTNLQALSALLYKCDLLESTPEAFTESGQNLGIG